ncbi:MAG: tetratricopeptide repeat protein [Sulfuritalea sp.]|nr:tetratricopeptide repeat protein [Sulfuritalea sp.]
MSRATKFSQGKKPNKPHAMQFLQARQLFVQGLTLHQKGQLAQALDIYEKVLKVQPNHFDALHLSGVIATQTKKHSLAVDLIGRAIEINPNIAVAFSNRGVSLQALSQYDAAVESYDKAIMLKPDYAEAYFNRGVALKELKQLHAVVESYDKAIELKPDFTEAYYNRGNTLKELKQLDAAVASYDKAIELKPGFTEAYYNQGVSLQELSRLDGAAVSYRKAISIKPDYADAYNNLGSLLQTQGKLDNAIESFRMALSIKPNYSAILSSLLFALIYHPDKSAAEIFTLYQEYEDRFGAPCRKVWRDHPNNRETQRRLKVGYVSPDFRSHSVPLFLEPLLAHHDKAAVEVYAYAELLKEDAVTARCKSYVEHWIPTVGLSDAELAERIRSDGIDILVDLAGHTDKNRLGVFALKPAPVSVTWLGYCSTTGLKAIDYFLTDATCVPLGSEGLFSETPWRLEETAYVYRPKEGMGNVSPLPAATRGFVTFGTLTRAVRINYRTVRAWAEILKQVPGSRLVLDNKDFWDEGMKAALAAKFAAHGINRERLEIGYHSPPWDVLRAVDVGLDCFPANSVTTLFETLNMGIPFITLAERPGLGRCGGTILESVGHPEWIAQSEAEYIKKAVNLASDLTALAHLRSGLREKMQASPLMDEIGFARRVEAAFHEMFFKWSVKNQ